MAVITNRFQQAFIASMMYQKNMMSRPYIGVQAAANDRYFFYSDNSRLVFSNWEATNPNQGIEERRCVVMSWTPREEDRGEIYVTDPMKICITRDGTWDGTQLDGTGPKSENVSGLDGNEISKNQRDGTRPGPKFGKRPRRDSRSIPD